MHARLQSWLAYIITSFLLTLGEGVIHTVCSVNIAVADIAQAVIGNDLLRQPMYGHVRNINGSLQIAQYILHRTLTTEFS